MHEHHQRRGPRGPRRGREREALQGIGTVRLDPGRCGRGSGCREDEEEGEEVAHTGEGTADPAGAERAGYGGAPSWLTRIQSYATPDHPHVPLHRFGANRTTSQLDQAYSAWIKQSAASLESFVPWT